jgi:glucose-6-phosphate 1-dehydrogenase
MENKSAVFTLLGATGDLSQRKILPALYALFLDEKLPKQVEIIGFARRDLGDDGFRDFVKETLLKNDLWQTVDNKFLSLLTYIKGDLNDPDSLQSINREIERYQKSCESECLKLYYFSIKPEFYIPVIREIVAKDSNKDSVRLLIEKPFGHDARTARDLNNEILKYVSEKQVYRIDHYLHKRTIREIPKIRAENDIFKHIWKPELIDKIVISTREVVGVEDRGQFYDSVGALRDVGQNHLLALLSYLIMDRHDEHANTDPHSMRSKVLDDLEIMTEEDIVERTYRAQYKGYEHIVGVAEGTEVETYFKIKTFLQKPGWETTPIILEAGKKLHDDKKEALIYIQGSVIIFRFNPYPLICIGAVNKKGEEQCLLTYENEPRVSYKYVDEYASLLLDAVKGDMSRFLGIDEICSAWRFVDKIRKGWHDGLVELDRYEPGTQPKAPF